MPHGACQDATHSGPGERIAYGYGQVALRYCGGDPERAGHRASAAVVSLS
jgi:hypothetical protein